MRPAEILCLDLKSFEAYCLDEAVMFFGTTVENDLQQAGNKPGKGEKKAQAAREAYLKKLFDDEPGKKNSGYSDPALMFS